MRVEVEITNRTAKLVGKFPKAPLIRYWSYFHPNYGFMIKAKPWIKWDGRVKIFDPSTGEVPAGLFWATRKEIESNEDIQFHVTGKLEDLRLRTEDVVNSDRPYQNKCVSDMIRFGRFGGGLVLAATGSGKTMMAAMFMSRLKGTCVFMVDQLVLLEQARAEFEEVMKEPIGIVGKSLWKPERITVATVQTMHLHRNRSDFKKWTRKLDAMIIDEVHEQMNRRNFETVQKIQPLAVYGLTATLQLKTKDVRTRAHALAGPVIFEFPLEQGQEEGILSKGVSVNVAFTNKMDKEDMETLSHVKAYTDMIVTNQKRNGVITDLIRESRKRGYYTICLVTRVRHLRLLSDALDDVPHRIVAGSFGKEKIEVTERMKAKDKFEEGGVRVLLANTVFKKGVNIKRVDVIIDAAAGSSKDDAIQKYGRGVRMHEEKSGLIYINISDVDPANKKNWFRRGARKRERALMKVGVPQATVYSESTPSYVFDRAEELLKKTLGE